MVAITVVRQANDALSTRPSGLVAVFVGATRGIGAGTLKATVQHLQAPKIYVLGRSKAKCLDQLTELETLNAQASIVFMETDVSLLKNVDSACRQITAQESRIDLLYMSQGMLPMDQPDYTSEGLDKCFALSYYTRMRFIDKLLPLLTESPNPRVVSVLAGGQEKSLVENDLDLKDHYSFFTAIDQTTTMHTLALEHLAPANPTVSFLHVFPGMVKTDIIDNFLASRARLRSLWARFLATLASWLLLPILHWTATSPEESGERQLFHVTSSRYPSAQMLQSSSTGSAGHYSVGQGGEEPPFACSVPGNGVYRVLALGETASDAKVLGPMRESGMRERISEHTTEVFRNVLGQ